MRAIGSCAISFGLVNIPVKIYPATEEKTIHFHNLHKTCGSRLKYLRWCPFHQAEVPAEEIIKGYEYARGQYVMLTDEDLVSVPLETVENIELLQFVNMEELDPIYYQKTYYLGPAASEKAFALLKEALVKSERVGIGKLTLRQKEGLILLRPYQDILALEMLYYPDEIRSTHEIPELEGLPKEVQAKELAMALQLVESMSEAFMPERYEDQYREALGKLIEQKVAGQAVISPPKREAKVIDLMEALKESVEKMRERKGKAAQEGAS